MIYALVKERYEYFYCAGERRGGCNQPYVPAETLEQELISRYHLVKLTDDFQALVSRKVAETAHDEQAAQRQVQARVNKRLRELSVQEDRYLDLIGDPDWPQEKIKAKLAKVRKERNDLAEQLTAVGKSLDIGRQALTDALTLLADPYELYWHLPDPERRLMTLAVFGESLKVDTKEIVEHQLRSPFAELVEVQQRRRTPAAGKRSYQRTVGALDDSCRDTLAELEGDMQKGTLLTEGALAWDALPAADVLELSLFGGQSWYKAGMVETQGLEPWTPCLQSRCSSQLSYVPIMRHLQVGFSSRRMSK
jgi:hypothetical protein